MRVIMRGQLFASLALSTLVGCGSVVAKPDAQEQPIDAPPQIDAAIDAACVGSQTFAFTGSTEMFSVPTCATSLRITAEGAQGGGSNGQAGGLGASMAGDFIVAAGDVLTIRVGGAGIDGQLAPAGVAAQRGGSGGGGTYVINNASILVIAGGGGGAIGGYGFGEAPGGPGQITTSGQAGEPTGAAGGTAGNGGGTNLNTAYHGSTGGGGYMGNGLGPSTGDTASYGTANQPGMSFINGSAGGAGGSMGRNGGFGGGGASGYTGGGGGGYSGGGAGANILSGSTAPINGGGGGSINNGTNPVNTVGARAGNGTVTITW